MVTIVGGGIAGSTLAGALARRGHAVTLHERQGNDAGGGAFLFIDGRGHHALTALGVSEPALHEASYPLAGLKYTTSNGQRSEMASRGHRFWLRDDLMRILDDFVARSGADVRYGSQVIEVTVAHRDCTIRTGTDVTTTDGLLVAADGINSVVRTCLEPDRRAVYAGDVVMYGTTTCGLDLPTDQATLHFFAEADAAGGMASSTLGHFWHPDDDHVHWFIRLTREALAAADDLGVHPIDKWADTIIRATPSNADMVDMFLANTDVVHVSNARNVPLDKATEPTTPALLVGDADHAITPAAGVGAREALEDVHAVFQAITSNSSPAAAMAQRRSEIVAERDRVQRARRGR
ncbi:FAD-dependent oxidoreductase [Nocardia brasiliensis]|uniref:FAD-dependent oxidoreductase n=1 Tax=Nocardia brasiliensis TaxID=37326 RepID=UPI00366DFBCC